MKSQNVLQVNGTLQRSILDWWVVIALVLIPIIL